MNLPLDNNQLLLSDDEQLLIKALRLSDQKAQHQFYERYFGRMFGIAYRYASSREDAYEIINTAFLKVFTSIENYREMGNFAGWVATIVKRSAQDHCKRYDFEKGVKSDWNQVEPKTYNAALSNLAAEEIFKVIQQLPPASRTVFNLFVIDGFAHQEIAEQLSISVGTSKWHLANARKKLVALLDRS